MATVVVSATPALDDPPPLTVDGEAVPGVDAVFWVELEHAARIGDPLLSVVLGDRRARDRVTIGVVDDMERGHRERPKRDDDRRADPPTDATLR